MPKVIKSGKKEFITVCNRCGCEFTYTLDELLANYPLKYVKCPDCGNECHHPDQNSLESNDWNDWIPREALKEISKSYKDNQCPVCGFQMVKDTSVVLTTYPPQYRWFCPHCGHSETRYEHTLEYKTAPVSADDWSYHPTITKTNTGTGCEYKIPVSSECSENTLI